MSRLKLVVGHTSYPWFEKVDSTNSYLFRPDNTNSYLFCPEQKHTKDKDIDPDLFKWEEDETRI